ncbi:MAG: ABC transporter ATP-binding protein [Clostridium sp.]|uniref:ABC transporter ATP-binding protein n=1 Tax=Clostridium sp. TaxID=1506 RepID=UPI002911B91E|nr:ABC transporter ATP-binding protein [Clostridium sp.]MDU5110887.1 ABC transporter ATP-binding protein [Clostridium sp.]
MEEIIRFDNIKKSYGNKTIVEEFNLLIKKGDFLTIIGSSGSGKTTILKMINGLITPESGKIFIKNKNIEEENIIDLRRNIGYAIQGSVLFPHMTVEENIAYVPNLLNKKDKEKTKLAVKKWMDIVGLEEEMLNRYPDELSGGQQQRVGIARSLAASPDILLMDEPFGAVDEITRGQLQEEILNIHNKTGITIIFVTHDISEAIKLGTKVLVMNEGKIEQYSEPKEILKNPATDFVEALVSRERHFYNITDGEEQKSIY